MAPAATAASKSKTSAKAAKTVTADVDLVRSYLRDIGRVPLLFDRMGLDPALMSTPFITTCTDVAGTLIYLKTAGWLLVHLPQLVQATGISTHFFAFGVF